MAYKNFTKFFLDFNKCYPKAGYEQGVRAYTYYCHGLNQGSTDGLTIGLITHLQDKIKQMGSVMGTSAEDASWHNSAGKIFVDESSKGKWQIWHNDAFILGGIHSHGNFQLVAPNAFEKWFEDKFGDQLGFDGARQLDFITSRDPKEKFPLRVTQREVIGLNSFGYTGSGTSTTSFVCKNTKQADDATLYMYQKKVNSLTKALGFTEKQ